jgi:hypothetical protein
MCMKILKQQHDGKQVKQIILVQISKANIVDFILSKL